MQCLMTKKEITGNRSSKTYYLRPVNISFSFKTLENLAKEMGADVQIGDMLVVDNAKGDKRKAFIKNANGSAIMYACMRKGQTFIALSENNGVIRGKQPLINMFIFER